MTSNSTEMSEARSLRLLSLLARSGATLVAMPKPDVHLLRLGENRTVKCPTMLVRSWLSSGLAKTTGDRIRLTEAGSAFLKRAKRKAVDDGSPNPFAAQHMEVRPPVTRNGAAHAGVYANANESPLARLLRLKNNKGECWISPIEFDAGDRLRRDFERANAGPRLTRSLDLDRVTARKRSASNPVVDESDNAIAARERFERAMDALGPELSGLAVDVCCFLKGLEQVELERQWPRRSAKVVLKAALDCLANHYFPVARGRASGKGIVTWHGDRRGTV